MAEQEEEKIDTEEEGTEFNQLTPAERFILVLQQHPRISREDVFERANINYSALSEAERLAVDEIEKTSRDLVDNNIYNRTLKLSKGGESEALAILTRTNLTRASIAEAIKSVKSTKVQKLKIIRHNEWKAHLGGDEGIEKYLKRLKKK